MYVFGMLVLFGLGVTAVVAFLERPVLRFAPEVWGVLAVGLCIALAWLARVNMWALWGLPVRAEWIGITHTGMAIGGIAFVFLRVLGLLASLHGKFEDEAVTIEKTQGLSVLPMLRSRSRERIAVGGDGGGE